MPGFYRADYVVARAEDGHVIGVARLLPTTSPYLLGNVFLQLMDGAPLPCAPDTWELSRFAVLDPLWRGTVRQFDSRAAEVLDAVLVDAANHGVTRLVTVSPLGVERLLRRCGFRAKRAGSPRRVGADHLFACWIDVPFVAAPAGTRKRAEPLT